MQKKNCLSFITLFLIAVLYSSGGDAQTQQDPKIENPNQASLGVFGDVPVNLYTGTPNITIAIHTLEFGKIHVPITLRYHPSSVKPAIHPGWVGLGWSLDCYGSISRTVKRYPDELYQADLSGGGLGGGDTYYPAPASVYNGTGSSGSEKVNVSNWDAGSRLHDYFTISSSVWPISHSFVDVQADEFSFYFGGHSGKFYYSGPQLGWQVVSSENIKVELYDFSSGDFFLNKYDIFGGIGQYHQFTSSFPFIDDGQGKQSRMFKGFALTVEDGTKYIFGGADAVEYSCLYGTHDPMCFTADNWLLKKIIDVNGNVVTFDYTRLYPAVSLYFGQTDSYFSAYNVQSNFWQCPAGGSFSNGTVNAQKHSGALQWPMYLTKISCSSGSVEFTTADDPCLRYTDIQLTRIDENGQSTSPNLFDLKFLGSNQYDPANVANLKWERLEWIKIKNVKQDIVKQYSFGYNSCNTSGPRLTLNSLTELNSTTVFKNRQYKFDYDAVSSLPLFFGNYTDHWGFFNNNDENGQSLTQILANNVKETNTNYVTKGLLTSITYPTGGYSLLTWEPHDYSAVVSLTRNGLTTATGYAGGSRIARIQNYTVEGALLSEKNYYYKKNYYAGASKSSLTSSGVLNGLPRYYSSIQNRYGYDGTARYNIDIVSLNSLSAYSYNAQGSYIGYDEVTEINGDGSYTRNFFTNYGTDINNVPHYDIAPSYIGWQPGEDSYIPMNSLEMERGLPIAIYKYNAQGTPIQTKIITYRNDQGRFNNYVKIIDFSNIYSCRPGG